MSEERGILWWFYFYFFFFFFFSTEYFVCSWYFLLFLLLLLLAHVLLFCVSLLFVLFYNFDGSFFSSMNEMWLCRQCARSLLIVVFVVVYRYNSVTFALYFFCYLFFGVFFLYFVPDIKSRLCIIDSIDRACIEMFFDPLSIWCWNFLNFVYLRLFVKYPTILQNWIWFVRLFDGPKALNFQIRFTKNQLFSTNCNGCQKHTYIYKHTIHEYDTCKLTYDYVPVL